MSNQVMPSPENTGNAEYTREQVLLMLAMGRGLQVTDEGAAKELVQALNDSRVQLPHITIVVGASFATN